MWGVISVPGKIYPRGFRSIALMGAVGLALAGMTMVGSVAPAHAAPGDGIITVIVDRDFGGDGVYDAGVDRPQKGIDVAVTDAAGTTVNGVTDAAGQVIITNSSPLTGGKYLVETSVPAALGYLQAAPASAGSAATRYRSFTTFVDVSSGIAQTIRVGVWDPADYAPVNPDYVLATEPVNPDGSLRTLVRSNWVHRGDGNGDFTTPNTQNVTTIAIQSQTGGLFGTAWAPGDRVFSSAFAKAFIGYGPAGPGGIYLTDASSGTPNASAYVTIPNAGTTAHQDFAALDHDDPFFAAAGTESLGGIALSDDNSTLYVVNLNDKRLYEVDATGATGSITGSVPIADPGCVGGEWRPGAVTVRDGSVYVGGVCDASVSANRADLRAYVLRLVGGTFQTVLQQPLDFLRGPAADGGTAVSAHWNPWRNTWSRAGVDGIEATTPDGDGVNVEYPTPFLTTLEFDTDGSVFLGFRDRFSDQLGNGGSEPDATTDVRLSTISGGDLNKACINPDGSYSWEGTNGCPDNTATAGDGGENPNVVEFFAGDWISLSGSATQGNHYEVAQGGMAFSPRNGEIGSTTMDPTGLVGTGGVGFFNTSTGQGPGGAPTTRAWLVSTYPESFGKGNGLGDLDLFGAAPVQIGNRVWYDRDNDGVQDADERPLPGATVSLVDGLGAVVATTTTDASGEYYFGGDGAAYLLTLGASYTVRFDVTTADTSGIPGAPPTSSLTYTTVGAGGDATRDSDAVPTGAPGLAEASITAPSTPGAVDHSIDAGVFSTRPSVSVGDFVWVDRDKDGVQDAGEPGIQGVVLKLTGPGGTPVTDVNGDPVGPVTTDANGSYSFGLLPVLAAGQHYTVTIDQAASAVALAPYVSTQSGAGTPADDSSTNSAESVDLTTDGDHDGTLDFGFVLAPTTRPGGTSNPPGSGLALTGSGLAFTGATLSAVTIGMGMLTLLAGAVLVFVGRRRAARGASE
jgi:hypothetical protein